MKSIMKSAFAIIAVALMIMVAVVPMVGVVTDNDSSATTTIDVTTPEYVTVSGKVTDSANKAIIGATIDVGGVDKAITDSTGAYSFRMAPTSSAVAITAEADDEVFQTITVDKIVADKTIDFKSNMVCVTVTIQSANNQTLPISMSGISVKLDGTDVNAANLDTTISGQVSFYAKIGQKATFSATSLEGFSVTNVTYDIKATNSIKLTTVENVMIVTLSPAVPNVVIATADGTSGLAISSTATTKLDGKAYFAYTSTATSSTVTLKVSSGLSTTFGTLANKTAVPVGASATYELKNGTTLCKYISGSAKVDGIAVIGTEATVTFTYITTTNGSDSTASITTTVDGNGNYFLGLSTITLAEGTTYKSGKLTFNDTSPSSSLFTYNEISIANLNGATGQNFTAQNAVKISGNTGYPLTSLTMAGTYFTNAVTSETTLVAGLDGSYALYVKVNDTTGVTITAPVGKYTPAVYTYKDLYVAQTANFTPIVDNTYTVSFALNGVPLYLAEIVDLGDIELVKADKTSFSPAIKATFTALYNEATITASSTIDVTECYLKVPATLAGYYFGDAAVYYAFEDGMVVDVEGQCVTITAVDAGDVALEGAKVKLSFATGTSTLDATIIKEIGEATIDATGNAYITAALPSSNIDGYILIAEVDGVAAVGDYTFTGYDLSSTSAVITRGTATVEFTANEKTTSGTVYTTTGSVVAQPSISYVEYDGGKIVGQGSAKVVDGVYYIVTGSDVDVVKIKVSGYTLQNEDIKTNGITAGSVVDIEVKANSATTYKVEVSGLYSDKVKINAPETIIKGTVITFSAISEYTVEDSKNQYTDGYTKYTFKAWYVNGKQVSTDAVTSYTIGDESIVVSADYTVEHVTTGEVKVEEKQGVDSTVLVIGIAAVVIALIAVIYAVIQRKN